MIQNNILVNNNNSDSNSLRFFTSLCETNSILQPSWGTGPATFSRASAQYITDFEGVVRKVESGCVAVEGSRVVTNLLRYSEDLSNSVWDKINCTAESSTVTVTSLLDYHLRQQLTSRFASRTVQVRVTFEAKRISGTGDLMVDVCDSWKTRVLTTEWLRYSVDFFSYTFKDHGFDFVDFSFMTTGTYGLRNIQLEIVTGQTNTNPGEYVKTTSAAVSKCFSTTNGNTVDANGVVTEATGTALPQAYSERQNSTAYALNDKIQVSGWWYNCTTAGTSDSSAPTFPQGKAGLVTVTDGTVTWTLGGRLLLGYVSEPASTNKVTAYGIIPADTLGPELSSGSLTIGQKYQITARTDADFTADGAADNNVGTQFVATAATVTLDAGDRVKRVQWGVGEKSFHNGSSFVQNITGLTLSGDTAAVLSIVTDQTEIEKAGLAGINPTYKVYKLDNSAGSTNARVDIAGFTGNTNIHSVSGIGRYSTNGNWCIVDLNTIGASRKTLTTNYSKFETSNRTPTAGTNFISFFLDAGKVFYFLLPQLEELPYATSIMPTAGATATRAATSLSYPTAGNLRGNDVTVGVEWTPNLSWYTGHNHYIMSTGADSSNRTVFQMYSSYWKFRKIISSTEYGSSVNGTFAVGTTYKILGRSASTGVTSYLNGTKGSSETNGASASLGTYVYPGSDYAGGSASPMYLRNLRIWFKPLSDDRCKQLTL